MMDRAVRFELGIEDMQDRQEDEQNQNLKKGVAFTAGKRPNSAIFRALPPKNLRQFPKAGHDEFETFDRLRQIRSA
jgi:hypothetical protein